MRALLIGDHASILAAFQADPPGFDGHVVLVSVESARGGRQALAGAQVFDFVLLDLQLDSENGFDLLAELAHAHPATRIVAVSGLVANADVVRAIYLGAAAFVPRHADAQTLSLALRTVASGHIYVPPMLLGAARVPAHAARSDGSVPLHSHATSPAARVPFASFALTPRQTEVLALLLQGQSNKLIARAMNLAVDTVKDHVTAVLRALNVTSRTQAVLAISGNSPAGPPRAAVVVGRGAEAEQASH